MKQYRLLRSNKESGPYSADEIIRMGLKAYDLIWLEGKSAAWRYPSELEEFKIHAPIVEEQPFDRFYKKPSKKEESKPIVSIQTVTTYPSVNTTKQKPRIRVSAAWNRIEPVVEVQEKQEQPVQKIKQADVQQINTPPSPSWQHAWLNWEEEKKAVETASKKINYTTPVTSATPQTVLQTKFSQSLDDIKERYVETVLQSKAGKPRSINYKNLALTFSLIIAVSAMGVGLWHEWNLKDETSNALSATPLPDLKKNVVPEMLQPANNASAQEQQAENQDVKSYVIPVREKNVSTSSLLHNTEKPVIKPQQAIPGLRNAQTTAGIKKIKNNFAVPTGIPAKQSKDINASANSFMQANSPLNTQIKNTSLQQDNEIPAFPHTKKTDGIENFIAVDASNASSSTGIENFNLHVQNVSDIPIDLVVMDLQYFDAGGKYRKGETVYVKNIAAGKSINIKAPDDKLSGKVTYKVSLVSAPQKDVYLIAD